MWFDALAVSGLLAYLFPGSHHRFQAVFSSCCYLANIKAWGYPTLYAELCTLLCASQEISQSLTIIKFTRIPLDWRSVVSATPSNTVICKCAEGALCAITWVAYGRYWRIWASVLICGVLCLLLTRSQAINHGPWSLLVQTIFYITSSFVLSARICWTSKRECCRRWHQTYTF